MSAPRGWQERQMLNRAGATDNLTLPDAERYRDSGERDRKQDWWVHLSLQVWNARGQARVRPSPAAALARNAGAAPYD